MYTSKHTVFSSTNDEARIHRDKLLSTAHKHLAQHTEQVQNPGVSTIFGVNWIAIMDSSTLQTSSTPPHQPFGTGKMAQKPFGKSNHTDRFKFGQWIALYTHYTRGTWWLHQNHLRVCTTVWYNDKYFLVSAWNHPSITRHFFTSCCPWIFTLVLKVMSRCKAIKRGNFFSSGGSHNVRLVPRWVHDCYRRNRKSGLSHSKRRCFQHAGVLSLMCPKNCVGAVQICQSTPLLLCPRNV